MAQFTKRKAVPRTREGFEGLLGDLRYRRERLNGLISRIKVLQAVIDQDAIQSDDEAYGEYAAVLPFARRGHAGWRHIAKARSLARKRVARIRRGADPNKDTEEEEEESDF